MVPVVPAAVMVVVARGVARALVAVGVGAVWESALVRAAVAVSA